MVNLISIEEFETLVANGEVDILLDARWEKEFEEEHIPGAIHMPWEEWNEPAPDGASDILHEPGYWGKLADPVKTDVAGRLTARGIGNDSRIVVCADGYRSKGREGRIAWMLLYFGAANVSMLDGGFRRWAQGKRVGVTPQRAEKPFVLRLDERRRAYKKDLEQNTPGCSVVDTRGSREFNGLEYDYQPRLGRIPDSVNIPFRTLLHANGTFVTPQEYKEIVGKHGIGASCIWYCEVGVRAAAASLLHEIYTGVVTPVYDGSFMEWSWDTNTPVESVVAHARA